MHDVVIAGAGSAGCVLAARLSEDPRLRVLLIDLDPQALESAVHTLAHAGEAAGVDPWQWVLTGGEDHALLACFPVGSTPLGFDVVDVVGGASYSGDWRQIGWTATASR